MIRLCVEVEKESVAITLKNKNKYTQKQETHRAEQLYCIKISIFIYYIFCFSDTVRRSHLDS